VLCFSTFIDNLGDSEVRENVLAGLVVNGEIRPIYITLHAEVRRREPGEKMAELYEQTSAQF